LAGGPSTYVPWPAADEFEVAAPGETQQHDRCSARLTSNLTRRLTFHRLQAVIVFHLLFLVLDKFPLWKIAFSIGCHLVYLVRFGSWLQPHHAAHALMPTLGRPLQRNFSSAWPMINLTSPSFMASCVLVLADHFIWFRHFSVIAARARTPIRGSGASPYARPTHASYSNGNVYHQGVAFMDVASFFGPPLSARFSPPDQPLASG
jgi:hypothetical protein